ncbi:HlyD family efflux transporter periplasmic adaptor subunit [Isoptericola dokdonensis]|jgi:multidrug resistance efflux pump|uniref:Multidrug resistance protein MdtN n=1 Tax=Isoptericola dokdonensis DS-3 TaxID=1300344 RepID=A0A168FSK2_9MICO|nr:HlyD family efflux transporter periplasmic adaptor subunit [Isoptericola dokdonensis]ANC32420.1 multidrug resistance protein MdtN [Isoptericola dokdonensis DS-3]
MTWATRMKLAVGVVVILALCATLTLVLNRRLTQALSSQATIVSEEVAVGTDYAGTIVESFVDEGDAIEAGEPMFRLRSLVLAHDLSIGLVSKKAASYEVTDDGEMTVVAPVDGVVAEIDATPGGFVQSGTVIATLYEEGTTRVDARLLLDPADFARIEKGTYVRIVLPDQSELPGEVDTIGVQNTRNRAEATVSVVSPTLTQQAAEALVLPGTPVVARVELRDEGPMAGPDLAFQRFLQRLGL